MIADDAELLHRYAAAHDEAAFAELVRRYLNLVYFAALRQVGGDAHRAEDVAQAVFTRLARKASALSRHQTLAGWLHTTTRFAASEVMRTERRRLAREQEAHTMHEVFPGSDPSAHADWERLRPIIDAALGDLSEVDREAVLLRFFAGLPLAQIGAKLNVSENAARMRVERALEKLPALLAKHGVTSTSAALGVALGGQAALAAPVGLAASVTSAALTGSVATGAAATAAGIFGFMSTAKIVVGVAVVFGVAGLGSAWREHTQAAHAEAAVAAMRRNADELRAQLARHEARAREAEERAQAGEVRVAVLQKEVASARVTSRSVAAPEPASRPAAVRPITVDPMLSNPEYFQLSMLKYRAELRQKFALLYKSLNLPEEQIAKFESNRTAFFQASLEIMSSADSQGVSTSDGSVSKLLTELSGSSENEIKSLLGDDGYRLYTQHSRSQSAFAVIKDLAGTVYRTDSPLSPAQGEQLAQAVLAQTRSVPVSPGSKMSVFNTDWPAVAAQAQMFLTPTQTIAFQALLDARTLQDRMNAISRAVRDPATPTPKK